MNDGFWKKKFWRLIPQTYSPFSRSRFDYGIVVLGPREGFLQWYGQPRSAMDYAFHRLLWKWFCFIIISYIRQNRNVCSCFGVEKHAVPKLHYMLWIMWIKLWICWWAGIGISCFKCIKKSVPREKMVYSKVESFFWNCFWFDRML